ncbi:MAG TPA: TPM domain-containing protein [Candidatus Limnocylindria bacterium]|nr:TPM domain-containing protein [Candidatus Limnocylindria bacterium]
MTGSRPVAILRAALAAGWLLAVGGGAVLAADPPLAGPPFPPPQIDVVVYDYAEILDPATETRATQIITDIEHRTGAEIVVYTQYNPGSDKESTEADAIALIDQWGVGRAGFDDGLAIMWNTNRLECLPGVSGNGQVQLYAAPGYRAAYLSNDERQAIFDDDMVPYLRQCDENAALLASLDKIDAAATPEHAQALERARIIDAIFGIVAGPGVFILLVGWIGIAWLRYGRDPVYLDDPSVLMPAPPPDLTAASGAVIWEGRSTRRALTTAMLDLASRGEIGFKPEGGLLGLRTKAGIQINETFNADDPNTARNRRKPLSYAEQYALERLRGIASPLTGNYIGAADLLKFGKYVTGFDTQIESHVVKKGWFGEAPAKATARWAGRAILILIVGFVGFIIGVNIPSGGVVVFTIALIAASFVMLFISRSMPARTMAGAMIYAMLAAYRRTMQATMAQARSMNQVVEQPALAWMETPDQATAWGVALGLQHDVEEVLSRSAEDAQQGVSTYNPWLPAWYGSGISSGSSGPGGFAPGMFSNSAIPNFGGMMAALSSIGNSPSSSGSGSGGSGGFSGGSSGGGGGGSGGGY